MKSLLVNYVYWQPVGHCIEALRYSLEYYKAMPEVEISVALNKHTPTILASLCPWIKNVYSIDIPDENTTVTSSLFEKIPKTWNFVVSDHRSKSKDYCPGAFYDYYRQIEKYLNVTDKSGFCGEDYDQIPFDNSVKLLLEIPNENDKFAKTKLINTPLKIAVMFAGNKDPEFFPSFESWSIILDAIYKKYGERVSTYFFGKLRRTNKSTLSGIERITVDKFLQKYPRSVDCFDLNILDQLAIIKKCGVFISPHTGFGFAVLSVGTPWLTISGGFWAEYYYNFVPFYSVIPDPQKYPCYNQKNDFMTKDAHGENRIASMTETRINEDLKKIMDGLNILINKLWSFNECMSHHMEKMKKYSPDKIWSIDDLHLEYV